MSKHSPDLYLLIHRLTTAEKRHFHRLAHLHRTAAPHYFCYFESLLNLPAWSPEAEQTALAQAPYRKHLPVVKRLLFDKLLQALDDLHRRQDPEEMALAYLHEAYQLLKKNLPMAANRRFAKAKKIIVTNGFHHLWPAYHRAKMRLVEYRIRNNAPSTELEEFDQDWPQQARATEALLRAQWQKLEQYAGRYGNLSGIETGGEVEVKADVHALVRIDQLQSAALRAFSLRDLEAARTYNEALLHELQQLDQHIKTIPERILSTSYNLLLDYLHLGYYDQLQRGLSELRALPEQSAFRQLPAIRSRIFEWGFQLECNLLLRQRDWSRAQDRLPELRQGLQQYGNHLSGPGFAALHLLGGLLAFHGRDFSLALEFLQPLYQTRQPSAARDLYRYGQYLNLLCHYRAGHLETAESLLTGLRRNRPADDSPAATQLLHYAGRLCHHPHHEQAILREWKMAYSMDSKVENYLCLSAWLAAAVPA